MESSDTPKTEENINESSGQQETKKLGKYNHHVASNSGITNTLRVVAINISETPLAQDHRDVNVFHRTTIKTKSKGSDYRTSQNNSILSTSTDIHSNQSETAETKINTTPNTIKSKTSHHKDLQDRSVPSTSATIFSTNDDHKINILPSRLIIMHPSSDLSKKINLSESDKDESASPRNSVKISKNVQDLSSESREPPMSPSEENLPLLPDTRTMHVPLILQAQAIVKHSNCLYICLFAFLLFCYIISVLVYIFRK